MSEQILLMENITKVYGNGFVANDDVTFSCNSGEVLALLGENGAGKTTLMKVLFGFETPDAGKIYYKGQDVKINDALDAIELGIGMVHQHFMLVDELSVAENMVLGCEPKKGGMFDIDEAISLTEEVSKKYNMKVDPRVKVAECTVGIKQKIEILKALMRGAELLILDEPTAVLTPQETVELFDELKHLREMGHAIIFISHKLNEVSELCDRFTVLRRGKVVGAGDVSNHTQQEISKMMVGRDVNFGIIKKPSMPKEAVATITNLSHFSQSGKKILDDVSFSLRKGEILGIAGVEGNGQNELSELITGLKKIEIGEININGSSIKGMSVRGIRELGVSNISEDRMTYGTAADMSIRDNIIADRYYKKEYSKGGWLNMKEIDKMVDQYIKDFSIATPSADSSVGMLSGGNIQKVVVAREFTSGANVIVANQPTRGVDVGASEFIRNNLVDMTRQNEIAVLLISADLTEVLDVSDSLIVMHNGGIVAYFPDSSDVDESELGEYMLGLKKMDSTEIGRAMS